MAAGVSLRARWLRRGVAAACVLPALYLGTRLMLDAGTNPIADALNFLGLWTLILLLASLACTPVRIVTGWTGALKLRKTLGLAAFFYALLHFVVYLGVDQFFDFGEILADITKRKFITMGFAAFALLVPLAVTSRASMVKRLGFPRWKRLHRLVYVAATLGLVHFVWRVKADLREPVIYVAVFALLMAIRVVAWVRGSPRLDA